MYHYSGPKYYTNPADPAREDDGLFWPGSMTWRVMDQRVMWVAGFRELYLQGLHPRVMRATWQNSSFADPAETWGRLFRTRMFVLTRTFGTTAEAERAGRRVRKIHESIAGTEPGGTSYRIDEPDLLLWVHNAEVASVIDVARRSGLPFSGADLDRFAAEQRASAARLFKVALPRFNGFAFSTLPGAENVRQAWRPADRRRRHRRVARRARGGQLGAGVPRRDACSGPRRRAQSVTRYPSGSGPHPNPAKFAALMPTRGGDARVDPGVDGRKRVSTGDLST
jgi:hypothetical protein